MLTNLDIIQLFIPRVTKGVAHGPTLKDDNIHPYIHTSTHETGVPGEDPHKHNSSVNVRDVYMRLETSGVNVCGRALTDCDLSRVYSCLSPSDCWDGCQHHCTPMTLIMNKWQVTEDVAIVQSQNKSRQK